MDEKIYLLRRISSLLEDMALLLERIATALEELNFFLSQELEDALLENDYLLDLSNIKRVVENERTKTDQGTD
ncbi:MAG: hypothetical protein DRO04_00960 [Candidatus Iainarchaeum archaeon]|uniref:Uncharacterized protein n=1 Tax=Candidatus Iainarchaeum sp. TaxID=3101447 RepID=A0A497JHQ0_9ARCH|nr:MAG: hypothetical protein DRO04_00960 [Candidatus Diapherotrites archaeon]